MDTFYVYRYTCPIRDEVIYIGKGRRRRWSVHLSRTDKHPLTQRIQWIRKQGAEPIIDFICQGEYEEFAFLVEVEAISKYGRKDLGKGPLLNLTDGGEGCTAPNPEARKRQGFHKKHTEETKRVISQKATAQFATEEARSKMSEIVKSKMTSVVKSRISERTKEVMQRMLAKGNHPNQRRSKPCTVDGVNIYPSRLALIDALGQGNDGARSANFRYVRSR